LKRNGWDEEHTIHDWETVVIVAEKILVALGGNAILRHREEGTAEEQFENVRATCRHMVELIKLGYDIAITHGNGPQVGDILLAYDIAKSTLPPMPLDVCGAQSQGMIGYMLQQSLKNELNGEGISKPVITVLTQCLVDRDDPAFRSPSKPIGPFYTAMEAGKLRQEKGWAVENDSGRGYRRLVPSPDPVKIIEEEAIRKLSYEGSIVIACGGGGVPVVSAGSGEITGIEAVIDKDHVAALYAAIIGADILLILTDVHKVALNWGRANQTDIDEMDSETARMYLSQGHFLPGSMQPKIESALRFIRDGGKKVIITSLENAVSGVISDEGTVIYR
jgi:carbamate kinase